MCKLCLSRLLPCSLQKVYKANYEKSRGFSINYCDTPKFQMDSVLKQFTDVRINPLNLSHRCVRLVCLLWQELLWVNENTKFMHTYVCIFLTTSFREIPIIATHSFFKSFFFFFRQITKRSTTRRWRATTSAAMKISTCSTVRELRKWRARYASVPSGRRSRFCFLKNHCVATLKLWCVALQQSYKAEYEDIKTRCFFPQTITPEYEAGKKLHDCSDVSSALLFHFYLHIYIHLLLSSCVCPFGFRLLYTSKKCCFTSCVFGRKPTGSIQTQWNSHKWRIPQSWFKPPSTPSNSVT